MRVNLNDPRLFERNSIWPVYAWLRANDPVHWHDDEDGGGFWVLSRYHDIVRVYTDTDTFSSRYGMRLGSDPEATGIVAQRMLVVSDPPEHTKLRQVLMRGFNQSAMPRIERIVAGVAQQVVEQAVSQQTVDMVRVARRLPSYVICELLGVPTAHWDRVSALTTQAFCATRQDDRIAANGELMLLFTELLEERKREPADDLISLVCGTHEDAQQGGRGRRRLSDEEVVFNCNGVLAGANETSRYSAAGAALALTSPRHLSWYRGASRRAKDMAVEEILRWTCPGVHGLRTTLYDTDIAGVPIAAGDRVTLWNASANHDEVVFADPDSLRLDRTPNRHLTFGAGRHFCIGAKIARLEIRSFMTELVRQCDRIDLAGEPTYSSSNFTWGLRALPVRLRGRMSGSL